MAELKRRRVVIGQKLIMNRLGDFRATVAEWHTKQARRGVQHSAALVIDEIRALGFKRRCEGWL